MVKKKKSRLEKLLARIKSEHNISLNEGNYRTRILEKLQSPPSLLDYFRKYMKGDEITLEWGCLMFLFIDADKHGDVHSIERYYNSLKGYPPNYLVEFAMARLEFRYYGKFFKAKEGFLRALELKPNDAHCYYNLGLLYNLLGIFDVSISNYENAALYSQNSNVPAELKARSLYNIAAMKLNINNDRRSAKLLLEETLEAMPDYELARQALRSLR